MAAESKIDIIFVVKTDGQMVLTPRRNVDNLPHPYLASGEDVMSAGTIIPRCDGALSVTNDSGHYKPLPTSTEIAIRQLRDLGYNVLDNSKFFLRDLY